MDFSPALVHTIFMRIALALLLLLLFSPVLAPESPAGHFTQADRKTLSETPDNANVTIIVLGLVDSPYAIAKLPKLGYTILHGPKLALLSEVARFPYAASLNHEFYPLSLAVNIGEGIPKDLAPYGRTEGVNGSGIVVAVVDTGVDASHPMLSGKVVGRYDARGELSSPGDPQGHGTLVASVIAGKPVNGTVHFTDCGLAPEPGYAYPFSIYIPEKTTVNVKLRRDNSSPGYDMLLQVYWNGALIGSSDTSTDTNHVEERSGTVDEGTLTILAGTSSSSTGYNFTRTLEVEFYTSVPIGGGIAQGAKIYGVKVFSSSQETTDTEHILYGIEHVLEVAQTYHIRVVNLSLGTTQQDTALDQAMETLMDNGLLPVVAAGNSGPNYYTIGSPAESPRSLAVGAATIYGSVAYYSSRGDPSVAEIAMIKPDVLAVGGGLYVGPRPEGAETNAPDLVGYDVAPNDLTAAIGTSFAAPTVSGIAALVFSALGDVSPYLVKSIILAGTYETVNILPKDAPPNSDAPNQPTLDRIGKDAVEGWGMTYLPAIMNAVLRNYTYGEMPNITMTFGSGLGEPKVYAFTILTHPGENVTFSLLGSAMLDVDMLVFSLDENEIEANIGNPVLVAASTSTSSRESVSFIANSTKYLLVIRRVSGSGNVTLTYQKIEDTQPPVIESVKAFMVYRYLSLSVVVTDNFGVTSVVLKDQSGRTYYLTPRSDTERYYSGFIEETELNGIVIARDVGGNTVTAEVHANGTTGLLIVLAFSIVIIAVAIMMIRKAGE